MGCAFEVIETLVLTLVIFFVVQTFIAQPFRVKGQSMQHSFENDQYVLVDKLTPHWDGYHRGDVVVLDPPRDFQLEDNEPFIKRIVGLPGEIVELRDGQVIINGTPLDESYTYNTEPTEPLTDAVRWVIGPNQVFVLGDHRQRSEDSRAFGPIDQKSIVGRAWLRYWPLTALGMVSGPPYPEPTK
jgi:signal peptidase I